MAVAAALFYGFPAKNMTVIGVTGTNGKTTTCNILHTIFQEAGVSFREVGVSSINEF